METDICLLVAWEVVVLQRSGSTWCQKLLSVQSKVNLAPLVVEGTGNLVD